MQTPSRNQQKKTEFHTPSCIIENKHQIYNFFKEKNSEIQRIYESYILTDFQKNNFGVQNFHIDSATTKKINLLQKVFNEFNKKYNLNSEEIEVDIFGRVVNIKKFLIFMYKNFKT